MIPVLFGSDAKTYTTNGLGRLTDCISCLITEERNGIYELELTYPISGAHYDKLVEGNIIVTTHDEQKDKQPFIIYRITRPISGVVTVNAHHVSYALANVIVSPFTATSVTDAFNYISTNAVTANPFTFWTDKTSSGTMSNKVPTPAKSLLGGQVGSVLDSFGGGEYEFDGYTVKLYANRGNDNGVTIRYGKNLTDLKAERDVLGLYNAVIPFWTDNENTVVYGGVVVGDGGIRQTAYWTDENNVPIMDENGNTVEFSYYVRRITTMDLSSEFDEQPTVAQLEARALTILNSNQPWLPKDSIKVDFVALWQTEEYASVAPLERVRLCDTVSVYYPELGVDAKSKVIKVVWDALLDRYDSIELGAAKSSFAEVITAETIEKSAEENKSMMDAAIQHATDLITGGLGGHIVFLYDSDGHPTDMLVMDTDDVDTAVHVLRINVNGIGFSTNGVSGTYRSAWTLDGSFVADFITAGTMSANRIQGGTLTLGGNNNGNGVIVMYNSSGVEIGRWNNGGLRQISNSVYSYLGTAYETNYGLVSGNISFADTTGLSTNYGDDPTGKSSFAMIPKNNSIYVCRYALSEAADSTAVGNVNANTGKKFYIYNRTTPEKHEIDYYAHNGSTMTVNMQFLVETAGKIGLTNGSGAARNMYINPTNKEINIESDTAQIYMLNSAKIMAYSSYYQFLMYAYNGTKIFDYHPVTISGTNTYRTEILVGTSYIQGDGVNADLSWGSKQFQFQGSSSKRYKHDISEQINEEINPHRLYKLRMKQFVFNSDRPLQYSDMYEKTLPGFIAEDVAEIYPAAVIHNADGDIENWDERRIVPGMLKLIQEQHEEIESLKERLAKLEDIVMALTKER